MEGLTEGRIVHFVLDAGPHAGEHRPAIVVKVWRLDYGDGTQRPPDNGCCNLKVFLDGSNDDPTGRTHPHWQEWQTSVLFSEEPKPRTWHWIEKA